MRNRGYEDGFTVIEVLVTLVLAVLFLVFFVQMFQAISAQQISATRQSKANNIASSNLNKFARPSDITPSYTCDTSTNVSTNTNNLAINPDASGTVILNNSSANKEPVDTSLGDATQEVRAFSPYGCQGANPLIKLISKVTYGFSGQQNEVVYATYIQN